MNKIGIAIIAALLLAGCSGIVASPATGKAIKGYTVKDAPVCLVTDLSTESKALITRWWLLNKKGDDGTLTPEEYAEGLEIYNSRKCGLIKDNIPVVIVLLDGTISLAQMPDGSLLGFTSGAFVEAEVYKEYRE